ncbi:DUF1102 domain-containing protein [Halorubrum ezzemoulense]|uniref:DUF1102 domain-containing protein n=1 Tax=Halorubrum ezzemoulense TaxID=337243 RepID=A0A256IW60_HALEZ|nr:DUF1102 domain-containing protein [Halorubrum ezzemoulense]OYR60516.1 hypothetical protein DJ80_15095 [Halorubrum ezzemoulense]
MKRRTLLTSVGSLAATSAVAVGTGAFTSVSADRAVSVEIADDSSALLMFDPGLKSSTNDAFASYEDGQLVLDFDETDAGGQGVNHDAVSQFDQVFKLVNRGTQAVNIWFEHDLPGVTFYRFDPDSNSLDGPSNAKIGLAAGGHMKIGVEIDTTASGAGDVSSLSGTVTIHASAESPT